jgi:general secretion pathway protein J
MTLLGLLSVVLFGSLQFGVRSWERSETLSTQSNAVRQVQALLTGELSEAYPKVLATDPTRKLIDFEGKAHSLSYLTLDSAHPGALDRVVIGVTQGTDSLRRSARLELSSGEASDAKTLLHGVAGLEFSYFGKASEDRDATWQDNWQGRESLPTLIRIRARFVERGAAPWPELIVAPRLSADVTCTFDPLIKGCREP